MEKTSKFEQAVLSIYSNMQNVFIEDEEVRNPCAAVDFGDDGNKLFTAELLAMAMQYKALADKDCDLVGFISVLNRMAVQYLLENGGKAE